MKKIEKPSLDTVEAAVTNLLKALNLDLSDPHMKDTPRRIAKMYIEEIFSGLYNDPPKMTVFRDPVSASVVTVANITVNSICSHHFVPFYGKAVVIYHPVPERVVGLSKFSRIVDYFARRPQVQERLTDQIASHIYDVVAPHFIVVGMKCRHLCVSCRGANDSAVMQSLSFRYHPAWRGDIGFYVQQVNDILQRTNIE